MNIRGMIKGLHHVTATVDDARDDYNFYVNILGQRLIKETVNFDNENVYHFYYGNETGLPSTIFTTFPYRDQGVRKGVIGTGQVFETAFSATEGSISFWKKRLQDHRIEVKEEKRFERKILVFRDPSGLNLSIFEDANDLREPVWLTDGISADHAIRGVHHVTLAVESSVETIRFLEEFGYEQVQKDRHYTMLSVPGGGAGNSLAVMGSDKLPAGINGIGTVHHVAHRVASIEDSLKLKAWLEEQHGINVTDIKDRNYFRSIYFRIPGGVLFEVATEVPGFMADESREHLGSSLKLPEWQEPHRERIEANLKPYRFP